MSYKIYFSKSVEGVLQSHFGPDLGADTLVVYHAMYDKPSVKAKDVIEWEKYKITYNNYDPSRIVLIGLNRMITPANRCDFIHAYLAVMTPHVSKVIIDKSPFIGEPWRLYFHYQIVNSFSKFGANYSYPIEGEWKKWFERDLDECKFSPKNIGEYIVDTWSDLPKLETGYELYTPDDVDREWYSEAKCFEMRGYRSPKLLLNNLVKMANKRFSLDMNFDTYLTNRVVRVPDLGIYRFFVEENQRRQGIYNSFVGKGNESLSPN